MDVEEEARLRRWAEYCRHAERVLKPREDLLFLDRLKEHFGDRVSGFSDGLLGLLHGLWRDGQTHGAGGMCSRCGSTEGVEVIAAMTAYDHKPGQPDPNHPTPYCPACAEEHDEFWREQWDEYYAGLL